MIRACDACLVRGRLIGELAARIDKLAARGTRPVAKLLAQTDDDLMSVARLSAGERTAIGDRCRAAAERERTADRDGGAVCIHDDLYPPRLHTLVDPPRIVYFTGSLERFVELTHANNSVAVVGSRRPSAAARSAARDMGRDLATAGTVVISGLAFGIDAEAHRGAVSAGGPAVAVLGCGVDEPYPRTNRSLHARVREIGTVISELPWGQKPFRWTFPARNRIMAALAEMTVVVEASQPSGSLITAEFALQLGRDLGAMPGPANLTTTVGSNGLLADGAHLVTCAHDVLDIIHRRPGAGEELLSAAQSEAVDSDLVPVLDAVTAGASIDEAAAASGLSSRQLRVALARLERAGHVRRDGLNGFVRATRPTAAPNLRGQRVRPITRSDVRPPRLLSIAGSDSGGGAGIQADLKAFARSGAHGMTAITAITAQNTREVTRVDPVAPEMIIAQVAAVADDIGVDAVKIGMLGDLATIDAVENALDLLPGVPVVLDPVMVAESGAVLLAEDARDALRDRIVPRATVITPNLPEARVLADGLVGADADAEDLARALHGLGPAAVVVTGGHRERVADVFFDGTRLEEIGGEHHEDGAAHGSGCTHSSTLAAQLGQGLSPLEAARVAKRVASEAVRDGLRELGGGAGPVNVLGLGRSSEKARGHTSLPVSRGGEVS